MPRANDLKQSFNAGELSPRIVARTDFGKYSSGCATVLNMIALAQGGLSRRPGTRHVEAVKDSASKTRLLPFEFSTEQAYVIEAGNAYFRFYKDQGRITTDPTDAPISNGTFDSNITDWDDVSTGGGVIAHLDLGATIEGTFGAPGVSNKEWGDATATLRKHHGLKFKNTNLGTVSSVKVKTDASHTANGDAKAYLYTDDGGSPSKPVAQVDDGSDTVTIAVINTEYAFEWSGTAPTLAADTDYWVIISNIDTLGNSTLATVDDLGPDFASGRDDTVTLIFDDSNSFGPRDLRAEIKVIATSDGVLNLTPGGALDTDIAGARQDVTTTKIGQEHVLRFRVRGAPGNKVDLRIATTENGSDIINDKEYQVGWHAVAFTPTASPFYVQFRNRGEAQNKDVYIDDVSLIVDAPVEITTPYATADLFALNIAQSADVLYIAHPSYPVYRLERSGHTSWSLEEVAWDDGPYLDQNAETTTFAVEATTGFGKTLTASSVTGINGGDGFKSTDVGRSVRIQHTANEPGWGVIVEFVSTLEVKIDIKRALSDTATTPDWRLGAWSETTGYPAAVGFFEQRFAVARTTGQAQSFWLSQSSDLENMRPDSYVAGAVVVEDDDALDYTFASGEVNAIVWMSPGQQLVLGTTGGEWVVESDGAVITPLDIQVKRRTTHGSADLQPLRIGDAVLFVQKARRKVREFAFNFEVNSNQAPDLTVLADHVTQSGVVDMAYQQEPGSLIHCVREDGVLAGCTYRRGQDVIGWFRNILGGSFEGGDAIVETVVTIPGTDGAGQSQDSTDRDEVWVVVKRTINGAETRHIEFMEGMFEGPARNNYNSDAAWKTAMLEAQKDAYYADGCVSLDSPIVFSSPGATAADPVVITGTNPDLLPTVSNGLINGDEVEITDVTGMTELNSNVYKVAEVSTTTFELLERDATVGISEATPTDPVVITTTANHGLSNGDIIGILGVTGMEQLNGNVYKVTNKSDTTIDLNTEADVSVDGLLFTAYVHGGGIHHVIDGSGFTAYASGGKARKLESTVSGLTYLEGETVKVLADGAAHADKTVASGSVTLDRSAARVTVGLGYTHRFESLKITAGAAAGTGLGKTKRIRGVTLDLLDASATNIGPSSDVLTNFSFREVGDAMDTATPLFTGEKLIEFDGDFERDARIVIEGDEPSPFTILALAPELKTEDGV